jgi:hypothetical protein
MPLATLLLPPVLIAGAAAVGWGLGLAGLRAGRPVAAGAAWLALAVLVVGWFAGGRTPVELTTPPSAAWRCGWTRWSCSSRWWCSRRWRPC